MEPKETEVFIETQGCLVVNRAYVIGRGDNVVALNIDMKSKRGQIEGVAGSDKHHALIIARVEDTCDEHPTAKGWTILSFPEFKGWRIWTATISRYTLAICLIKNDFFGEIPA